MADAVIGALRVALSLDSAQFSTGLKRATGSLDRFARVSKVAFAAVAAAGVAAAFALGTAVKRAADHADALSKTSQKIGLTVEALSRLEFAAKLSDVSLEQLSTGLGKLSQNLFEVASGRGEQARTSFEALGISVKDAAGNIKATDVVLLEIADRFSRMEDSGVKTALSMNLLGRSGRELIPLLNEGSVGLKRYADESDRLGVTIDTKTAKASERFNDALTRVQFALDGVSNRLLEAVLPYMEDFAGLIEDPQFQQGIVNVTTLVLELGKALGTVALFAQQVANILPQALNVGEDTRVNQMNRDFETMPRDEFNLKYGLGDRFASIGPGAGSFADMQKMFGIGGGGGGGGGTTPFDPIIAGAKAAKEAIDPFAARMDELSGFLVQTHDPFEQMKLDLTDLKTMWEQGRISTEQYGEAVRRVNMQAAISTLDSVASITGALAGAFKDNKAIAIANAIISTAAGAAKALEQGGMFGFAGAAAVIAAGAAQIHQIMSTNIGSSSVPSASSSAPAIAAPEPSGPAVNITLSGGGFYSRDQVVELIEQIGDAFADRGMKINLSPIGA